MLIVQQPDEKDKSGDAAGDVGGMAVYDFDADDAGEFPDDEDVDSDDKGKVVKMAPRRSQTVRTLRIFLKVGRSCSILNSYEMEVPKCWELTCYFFRLPKHTCVTIAITRRRRGICCRAT